MAHKPRNPDLIEMGQRIRAARLKMRWSQTDLGKRMRPEVTPQSVSQWESGRTRVSVKELRRIAALTNTNVDELVSGQGDSRDNGRGLRRLHEDEPEVGRRVPLIEMDAAADPSRSRVWRFTYYDCGPEAFAVTIKDQSDAPEYLPGDIVVIDPGTPTHPGSMVLAQASADGPIVFRRLRETPEGQTLIPLNTDWAPSVISDDGRIFGRMTEHARSA